MGKTDKNNTSKDSKEEKQCTITPALLAELIILFHLAPPPYLRKSLTDIFFSYLAHTESEAYKPEIREIATDFYLLLKFLEKAEGEWKKTMECL